MNAGLGGAQSVLRGVLGLSSGTIIARALATVGQLVLAFWLSPAEFGYWAAATSAISLLAGLANFGEVNAYLGGHGLTFRKVRKSTRIINWALVVVAAAVASAYFFSDRPEVGVLAVIAAVTIPLAGSSDLMYATGVKVKAYRAVVVTQIIAAVVKIAFGIAVAITTQSAIAIAVSTLVFYMIMDFGLVRLVQRATANEIDPEGRIGFGSRFKWAANSVAMSLPLQIGFLVAQFLATPELLGLYYIAFQVTLGITGLVSAPLSRVSLSTLGQLHGVGRLRLGLSLSNLFGLGMLVVASLLALSLPLAETFVPVEWRPAIPAIILMVASMPMRMMGPVVDAYQQATNRWWQSTTFNIIDMVGTAVAALFAISGDILLLVLAASLWKILLALGRIVFVFRAAGWVDLLRLLSPIALGSAFICAIPFADEGAPVLAGAAVALAVSGILVSRLGRGRRRR